MASEVDEWRQESEQRAQQRFLEEQKLARLEDAEYEEKFRFKPWDPFGKPGHGAPLNDTNKRRRGWGYMSNLFDVAPPTGQKVMMSEGFKDPSRTSTDKKEPMRRSNLGDGRGFLDGFGQPGAGAPLRTDSGNIITARVQDEELAMQANVCGKKTFLNAIPPLHPREALKPEEYRKELDAQHFEKVLKLTQEKKREIELEKNTNLSLEFNDTRKNEDPLKGRLKPKQHLPEDDTDTFNPWGKNFIERDENGFIKRHKHSQMFNGKMQLLGIAEDSGEHQKELRGQGRRATNLHLIYDQFGQPMFDVLAYEKFEPYDPFGKPGAGAPRRDEMGHILTRIPRFYPQDPVFVKQKDWSNKVYLNEIKEAMKEHEISKSEWNAYDKADCENFAEIVDRSRVGKVKRNPTTGFIEGSKLATTEITNPAVADVVPQVVVPIRQRYYEELRKQVEDRERRQTLDHIRERQEANQHYETSNQFWGRKGPGSNPPQIKQNNMGAKHRLADDVSVNIYEAFHYADYSPPRNVPVNIHNATSAQIRRVNSDSSIAQQQQPHQRQQQGPAPPTTTLPPYLTDSLYVPGGGLGYYAADLLGPSQVQMTNQGAAYSYAGQNNRNDFYEAPPSSQHSSTDHPLHKLLSAKLPYPIDPYNVNRPPKKSSYPAGKPSHEPSKPNHPGPRPGISSNGGSPVPMSQVFPATTATHSETPTQLQHHTPAYSHNHHQNQPAPLPQQQQQQHQSQRQQRHDTSQIHNQNQQVRNK